MHTIKHNIKTKAKNTLKNTLKMGELNDSKTFQNQGFEKFLDLHLRRAK